ncbi:MAG: Trm112 family protein [Acidobacteria bacterium]|nr:MAG: Trm112 family protein [Acidobacteriota bacterium]
MAPLESWLLELLVCPTCKTKVTPTTDGSALRCPACRVRYPIEDGIPQMVPEAAVPEEGGAETGTSP